MAGNTGVPAWSPERFKSETDRIVAEMLRVPDDLKLAYLRNSLAQFPEPYRSAAETILLQREALMHDHSHAGPMGFLREAIQAVPAVKYALGVGGVVSVIAIIGSFGVSYRVAVIGFPIILILMTLLVVFAKLAATNAHYFLSPLIFLTWFSILAMAGTVIVLFTAVFFKWPLDLSYWLAKG
jgi:hypothetical protein